jgi:hypothetical protein
MMRDGLPLSWKMVCRAVRMVTASWLGSPVLRLRSQRGEVAGRDLHADAVPGEEDVAGRPQVDLVVAGFPGGAVDAQDPVAEIAGDAVSVDVAKPHHPIGGMPRRSQASSIAGLIGLCAERIALKPAAFRIAGRPPSRRR